MKRYKLIPIFVVALSCMTACTKSPEIDEITNITLSEADNIKFGAEATTRTIEIQSSNNEWSVIGGNDWLKITKDNNNLILEVSRNETPKKRSTSIVITANQQSRTLTIEQAEGGLIFNAEKNDLLIDQWKEEVYIGIKGNIEDWTVVCSQSKWLTYEVNTGKKELHVTVEENLDRYDRSAIFYLQNKSGEGNYEVRLTQKGALYHILPYWGFNCTDEEITEFEKKRKSVLVGEPNNGGSFGNTNANTWTYQTVSKAFNRIDYTIEEDQRRYWAAVAWASDPMAFLKSKFVDDVEEFLKQNGFKERFNNRERQTYYNEERECTAILTLTEAGSHIRYLFEPKQPKPMPTFDAYPWGILENSDWRTYTKDMVEQWEAEHGGELFDESTDEGLTERGYFSEEMGGMMRYYVFSNEPEDAGYPLTDVAHHYLDTEKVIYNVKGMVIPTAEFRGLLDKSGFKWLRRLGGTTYGFTHKEKELYMGVNERLMPDPDNPDNPDLAIRLAMITYIHNPQAKNKNNEDVNIDVKEKRKEKFISRNIFKIVKQRKQKTN